MISKHLPRGAISAFKNSSLNVLPTKKYKQKYSIFFLIRFAEGQRLRKTDPTCILNARQLNFGTSAAYKAATGLVFKGLAQPSGYTEPLLHAWRLKVKSAA